MSNRNERATIGSDPDIHLALRLKTAEPNRSVSANRGMEVSGAQPVAHAYPLEPEDETEGVVSLKNMTIALIIALAYEIVLKLGRLFIPSLFNASSISIIVSALSFGVGIVIILFMLSFYKEEKSNKKVELVLRILIGCTVLYLILRLPITRNMIDYNVARLGKEIVGVINATLLFMLLIFYRSPIPAGEKPIRQAAVFATVMFGIGIVKSLYSLINFTRFIMSGVTVDFAPAFLNTMFMLFLMTHISIIYFLYRYYQLKSYAKS